MSAHQSFAIQGRGLLNPLDVPAKRWMHITMDFVTGLPRTAKGYDCIMVIVDRLTKRAHCIPTFKQLSAEELATLFRDEYQRLHGLPESIISDRDSKFTSTFWQSLMRLQQTQLALSTAFKPSTDGQTERRIALLLIICVRTCHPFKMIGINTCLWLNLLIILASILLSVWLHL